MNLPITIYEKPTCSTCRQVLKAFETAGVPFDKVNYIISPPSKATLTKVVAGLDVPAQELIRTKEEEFRGLGLDAATMSSAQIVDLLHAHPALMQRPVLVIGDKYVLGRPVDKVERVLRSLKKV